MNSKQALQTFGRSGNPMFSDKTFSETVIDANIQRMTLQGTVNKVGLSLLLVLISAFTHGRNIFPVAQVQLDLI